MKVELEWTEEVSYRSVIDIPTEEVLAYLNEGEDTEDHVKAEDVTVAQVKDFMSDTDFDWFEECDTTADFESVDERDLNGVFIVKEVPSDAPLRPGTNAGQSG